MILIMIMMMQCGDQLCNAITSATILASKYREIRLSVSVASILCCFVLCCQWLLFSTWHITKINASHPLSSPLASDTQRQCDARFNLSIGLVNRAFN